MSKVASIIVDAKQVEGLCSCVSSCIAIFVLNLIVSILVDAKPEFVDAEVPPRPYADPKIPLDGWCLPFHCFPSGIYCDVCLEPLPDELESSIGFFEAVVWQMIYAPVIAECPLAIVRTAL